MLVHQAPLLPTPISLTMYPSYHILCLYPPETATPARIVVCLFFQLQYKLEVSAALTSIITVEADETHPCTTNANQLK